MFELQRKSSLAMVTIFSCYQRFDLINFDGCCLIATSARFILFWKISTSRSLWLDSLLWPIFFFSVVSAFPLFLLFWRKSLRLEALIKTPNSNHNLARNAWWDFCPLVRTITRFSSGFRLKTSCCCFTDKGKEMHQASCNMTLCSTIKSFGVQKNISRD